ncbi:glycosyltransferase [Polaribacter sp. Hel1_85]|uniref:glycosyltransferase n=1 Tax=Polaribacter sp. Hel1_85 TaxID=1250005 RepID=UPI00052D3DF3|nr:glycosyltransferase [Polaribacter sp. Hel1_85]KGL59124.1 glycosyltransferase, GT4 family [Polaribacter sp. Hel1_85]
MRILHLISQKPDFTGSGTIYKQLSSQSTKANPQFLLYGTNYEDDVMNFNTSNVDCFVFDIDKLGFSMPGMSDSMPYKTSKFKDLTLNDLTEYKNIISKKLNFIINQFKPDIIWSHHLWILSSIASKTKNKIPQIAFCHGSDLLQHIKCKEISKHIKSSLLNIDEIILNSPNQINDVIKIFKPKTTKFIGIPVNEHLFNIKEKIISNGIYKMVYAGKISKEKGVHFLIKSTIRLLEEGYNIELILYGKGEAVEMEKIKKLAIEYKGNIIFGGYLSQIELSKELNKSQIFILPSFYEGLGLVIVEALLCGCRVVCNRLNNLFDILSEEVFSRGYIEYVDMNLSINDSIRENYDEYSQKLEKIILKQIEKPYSLEIANDINKSVSQFTFKSYYQKLINISKNLINEN